MARVSSLNRDVAFSQILPLCGLPCRSPVLPAVVPCPFCKAPAGLFLYRDVTYGGEWSHCRGCGFSGDMIELAARVWKLDVRTAILKLLPAGVGLGPANTTPAAIAAYLRDHVVYRQRQTAFYADCQNQFAAAGPPGLRDLQRRFGLERASADWPGRGGRILGGTTREATSSLFDTSQSVRTPVMRIDGKSLFRGRGWDDLLVIPFSDLPGRLHGFLFAGREARTPEDFVYRCISAEPTKTGLREAGIGMLDAAFLSAGPDPLPKKREQVCQKKATLFAFTEPIIALHMQLRHLREASRPLPLVLVHQDSMQGTQTAWEALALEELIFWGPAPSLLPIIMARRARALVSTLDIGEYELAINLRHRTPREWLKRIQAAAVPWDVALRQRLRDGTAADVEAAMLQLGMPDAELADFAAACDAPLRARLVPLSTPGRRARSVRFAGKVVHERDGGWYDRNNQISSGIIRLEQILSRENRQSYYRGTIHLGDQQIPFTEKTTTIEAGILPWAHAYLRDVARAGILHYHPTWSRKALGLALAFHEPVFADGVEHVGWDDKHLRFNFPGFTLGRGGEVGTELACLLPINECPAGHIPPPGPLASRDIDALSEDNEETRVFWAVAAAILANVTSYAQHLRPRGILLVGEGAATVGAAVAQQLGCLETQIRRHTDSIPRAVAERVGGHRWPTLLANTGKMSLAYGDWLNAPEMGSAILPAPPCTDDVLGLREKWTSVIAPRGIGSLQLLAAAAPYIVANYLQDKLTGQLWASTITDPVLATLASLAEWLERSGGSAKTVRAAAPCLAVPETHPASRRFVRLVLRLYTERHLLLTPLEKRYGKQVELLLDETKGTFWISQDALSAASLRVAGLRPDLLLITKALTKAKSLLGETEVDDQRGWLISDKWWREQISKEEL